MTPARAVAAAASVATVLLLQATLVAPAAGTVPISLPAVVVAAVAMADGPATGIAFGFAAGLVADLGSDHPAGVLALAWLLLGLGVGTYGWRRSWWRDALAVGAFCAVAAAVVAVALTIMGDGTGVLAAGRAFVPSLLGDVCLAVVIVPFVRRALRTERLRPPQPVQRELVPGGVNG